MKNTLKIFLLLVGLSVFLNFVIHFMAADMSDFEYVATPPKVSIPATHNPMVKVDAMSRDEWTLVDFSTGQTWRVKDVERDKQALNSRRWDLGFQRTKIVSNSGETNPGGKAGVVNAGPIAMDEVREAPASGYVMDSYALGKLANPALADWYSYRARAHNVESKKNVYVVRTADRHYLKMRILDYYCRNSAREEAACLTIEYVLQPDGSRTFPPPAPPGKSAATTPNAPTPAQ